MRIALCDDDKIFLDILREEITQLMLENNMEPEIFEYQSSDDMLKDHAEKNFICMFLDMNMPHKTGIEIAEMLRNLGDQVNIIFVTSFHSLVYDSFRFQPFRFIRKEKIRDEMPEAISMLCKKILSEKQTYEFKCKGTIINLKIIDIQYIESQRNIVKIYTDSEVYTCTDCIGNKEKEFKDYGFIRIHSGYLVNYKHIFSINKDSIVLDNQKVLPMSRYRTTEVKHHFMINSRCKL